MHLNIMTLYIFANLHNVCLYLVSQQIESKLNTNLSDFNRVEQTSVDDCLENTEE